MIDGDPISDQIIIKKVSSDYDIKVNGVAISPENAADVLGDQTVTYKKKSATLILTNSHIEAKGVPAIEAKTPVYITLVGENKISSDSSTALLLGGEESMIHGNGSIEVSAPAGTAIEVKGSLKIQGVNCTAKGLRALHGDKETKKKNYIKL